MGVVLFFSGLAREAANVLANKLWLASLYTP